MGVKLPRSQILVLFGEVANDSLVFLLHALHLRFILFLNRLDLFVLVCLVWEGLVALVARTLIIHLMTEFLRQCIL